jgi:hypothetical protein
VWTGSGGEPARRAAAAVAAALGLPLYAVGEGNPAALLRDARVLLHLAEAPGPCAAVWPLRALACGTPVAAWRGSALADLQSQPVLGALAASGDHAGLAAQILALPSRAMASDARRRWVVARHGRRAVVARCREIYAALVEDRESQWGNSG